MATKGEEGRKRTFPVRAGNTEQTRRIAQQQDQAAAFGTADKFETRPRSRSNTGPINPWAVLHGADRE